MEIRTTLVTRNSVSDGGCGGRFECIFDTVLDILIGSISVGES